MNEREGDGSDQVCLDPETGGLLNGYLDGEVTGVERTRVERHLELCAHCREELSLHRGVENLLRKKWPELTADDRSGCDGPGSADPETIQEKGDRAAEDPGTRVKPPFHRRMQIMVPLLLAAGLAFALILRAPWRDSSHPAFQAPVMRGAETQTHTVTLSSHGDTGQVPPLVLRPGSMNIVELTTIPSPGWPIRLSITGEGDDPGQTAFLEYSFQPDAAGYPLSRFITPQDLEPGTYDGHILCGAMRVPAGTITIILKAPR